MDLATTTQAIQAISLTAYAIGLLSSFVAELFKLIPALTKYESAKVLTAVVVMVGGTLYSIGFDIHAWNWDLFGQVVIWSFVNYKMIVQPVAADIKSRTQKPSIAETEKIEEIA